MPLPRFTAGQILKSSHAVLQVCSWKLNDFRGCYPAATVNPKGEAWYATPLIANVSVNFMMYFAYADWVAMGDVQTVSYSKD